MCALITVAAENRMHTSGRFRSVRIRFVQLISSQLQTCVADFRNFAGTFAPLPRLHIDCM